MGCKAVDLGLDGGEEDEEIEQGTSKKVSDLSMISSSLLLLPLLWVRCLLLCLFSFEKAIFIFSTKLLDCRLVLFTAVVVPELGLC